MPEPKSKALVILSGGQDSTTCLLWAKSHYDEVHAVSFDYGQRHKAELLAACKISDMFDVASHTIIDASGILQSTSPLIDHNAQLEQYTDYSSMDKIIGKRVELTFVPLRNLFFITVAANHGIALGCYDLITGVCAADNANYPDCTESFVGHTEIALRQALGMNDHDYTGPLLNIYTPLLHMEKFEIVNFARTFPLWEMALAESHTCYAGEVPPCGKCHACVLRAEGFKQANTPDPLVQKWATIASNPS